MKLFILLASFLSFSASVNAATGDRTISLETVVDTSQINVWRAWTESAQLSSWLTKQTNIEAREGGLYELFWEPDFPQRNSTIGCRITSYVPLQSLSFQWKGPVPFADIMNTEPLPTWVRITLLQLNGGRTLVRLDHFGWRSGAKWNKAKAWQESAWRLALERLQKSFTH